MTYREAIQKLQQDSNILYEKIGSLRDAATLEEKKYWNKLRSLFHNAYTTFGELDNSITDERGADKLKGTY